MWVDMVWKYYILIRNRLVVCNFPVLLAMTRIHSVRWLNYCTAIARSCSCELCSLQWHAVIVNVCESIFKLVVHGHRHPARDWDMKFSIKISIPAWKSPSVLSVGTRRCIYSVNSVLMSALLHFCGCKILWTFIFCMKFALTFCTRPFFSRVSRAEASSTVNLWS